VPSARAVPRVRLQLPLLSAVVVPSEVVPPRNSSTVALFSAVPLNLGVVTLVMLSVLELPLSLVGSRSGVEGALATESMVMLNDPEAEDTLPEVSVAVAVTVWSPSAILFEAVMVQFPPTVVVVPFATPSTSRVIVVPFSVSVPVEVGFLTLVMLSVSEVPLSVPAVMSGVEGDAGAVLSTVIEFVVAFPVLTAAALFASVPAAEPVKVKFPSPPVTLQV
jgi:hypothetical protein